MMLLIPIHVRALPVGRPGSKTHFSGFGYDMSKLGSLYENTEASLFQEGSEIPGIHLHWSLPDCFTHGIQDQKTGEITYRLAPNRWSVTRLWTTGDGTLQNKTFLLESDVLSSDRTTENTDSPSIPFIEDQSMPYRILGRSFDSSSPPPDYPHTGNAHIRLTAVSQNCPFFAAYAPGCQNVFGFIDRLFTENLSDLAVSYVVCGWYAEYDEKEPCSAIKNLKDLQETLGLTLQGDSIPNHALCHGAIDNVCWETENTVYPTGSPDDPAPGEIAELPQLGAGNTSAEALSALLAPPDGAQEHLLHHYLSGNAQELDRYYGAVKADSAIHKSHFYASEAYALSAFRTTEEQDKTIDGADPFEALRNLRKKQRDFKLTYAEYMQKQRLVYESWYLHYYSDTPYYRSLYEQQMQNTLAETQMLSQSLSKMQDEILAQEELLREQASYPLELETNDFFYTPVDPVILTSQLAPGDRPAKRNGFLSCRTEQQTISTFMLHDLPSLAGQKLTASDIMPALTLPVQMDAALQNCISNCITEAIFLSSGFAAFLALTACRKAGLTPSKEELSLMTAQIVRMQEEQSSYFQGIFPDSCSLSSHKASFAPLIAEWEVLYYPDMALLCKTPSLKNWIRKQDDYTFCGDVKQLLTGDNAYPVNGRFFISDTADMQLNNLAKSLSSETLSDGIRLMQHLSQTLDGFHSHLCMCDPSVAMDFFSFDAGEQMLMQVIKKLHPSVLGDRPLFDELFAPLRGGFISIRKIRLIDEMGYYQDIEQPSVYTGEGLLPPSCTNPSQYIMLPPRFLQPLHLSAFFADACCHGVEESFAFPETTPVCGYLVANYLEQSIMVYTAQGDHACSICLSQTGAGILIQNAPLKPQSPTPPADLDPQLAGLLNGLLLQGAKALQDMLSVLNQRQLLIRTGNHDHHTIDYFGKPIAVVRVALKLSLYGKPEAYRHNQDGGEMDKTCKTDITALTVPVQVGQPDNPMDGVFGYFEEGNFECFHSFPEVCSGLASDYVTPSFEVPLSLKESDDYKQLLLLMDPYAEANLITGLLPVKTLKLPHNLVTQRLSALTVSYFSAPVLCKDTLSGIPVPHTDSLDYYWVTPAREGARACRRLVPEELSADFTGGSLTLQEGYISILEKETPKE